MTEKQKLAVLNEDAKSEIIWALQHEHERQVKQAARWRARSLKLWTHAAVEEAFSFPVEVRLQVEKWHKKCSLSFPNEAYKHEK